MVVSSCRYHRLERSVSPRCICAITCGFQTTQDLSVFPFLPIHYHMTHVLLLPFISTVWTLVVLAMFMMMMIYCSRLTACLLSNSTENSSILNCPFTTLLPALLNSLTLQLQVLICSQYVLDKSKFGATSSLMFSNLEPLILYSLEYRPVSWSTFTTASN